MKKRIILGICVSVLVLLVAPTIPAQQYKLVEESIKTDILEQIDVLINDFQNLNTNKKEIDKSDFKYYKNSISTTFDSLKKNIESYEIYVLPVFLGFILSTLISLIFTVIGVIFGAVFGPILSIIVQILTAPAVLLAKLISFLIDRNSEIIT